MKLVIPWICVFALLVGCFYLYSQTKEDQKQIAAFQADSEELNRLRMENVELRKLQVEHDELVKLRNDEEELLRLRGEVGPLRKQNKDLTAQLQLARVQSSAALQEQHKSSELSAENQALRSQFEKAQQEQARDHQEKCIANLRRIEAAKDLWAQENQKPQGSVPTAAQLAPYCQNGVFPVCPDGGTYTVNPLGLAPTCSIPSHALPKP
jgi:hypothetical protein